MKVLDIEIQLERLREAREKWGQARMDFGSGYEWVLTRLVHEAAANYMGADQMARALGVSSGSIRKKMRAIGLDPKAGKRALNARASQAMLENSAIMGIEPAQMDLTSPLAYLPMGEQMRKQFQDATLARVTDLDEPEVSGNVLRDQSGEPAFDVLRRRGGTIIEVNGRWYDVRVEVFEGHSYVSIENVALLLGDDSHWSDL